MTRAEWLASLQTFDWVLMLELHNGRLHRSREQVVAMGDGAVCIPKRPGVDFRWALSELHIEPLPAAEHGLCCRCVMPLAQEKAPWDEYCWHCYREMERSPDPVGCIH